jgi:hypothetical protein
MSDQHLMNFVQDHARTGVGWEDWLGDYRSEMGKPDSPNQVP